MILQVISTFFATAAFSIVFYMPKKYIVLAGCTGSLGWLIYLICMRIHPDKAFANLIATLIVTFTSHILARKKKSPVTMFLIPGIIPMVPGAGMYRIVRNMIDGDLNQASHYLFETMQMAAAIALGIFIIDTFFRRNMKRPRDEVSKR